MMHTHTSTAARTATRVHRAAVAPQPLKDQLQHQVTEPSVKPVFPGVQQRVHHLVRNPLFLVVVTWLVMAGLLVIEILNGK